MVVAVTVEALTAEKEEQKETEFLAAWLVGRIAKGAGGSPGKRHCSRSGATNTGAATSSELP